MFYLLTRDKPTLLIGKPILFITLCYMLCYSEKSAVYETLLLELYLQYPYIIDWMVDTKCITSDAHSFKHSQAQVSESQL